MVLILQLSHLSQGFRQGQVLFGGLGRGANPLRSKPESLRSTSLLDTTKSIFMPRTIISDSLKKLRFVLEGASPLADATARAGILRALLSGLRTPELLTLDPGWRR